MSKISIIALKELLDIEMGQSPSSDFVNDFGEGIPLLNGPAEFTSRFPIPKQYTTKGHRFSKEFDILFCVRGSTTGRMNYSNRKFAIGRGLAAISHKYGVEYNAFAKALLDHNLKGMLGGSMGSVFPNLTKDQLLNYKCTVPDLSTQKLVSKIFSDLDSKIELNNTINAELEAMAKLIYDYWFVQFDFPDKNGKPYKNSGGKMVWNEELKREIPEGWEVKQLGKILRTELGGTPSTKDKDFWDGEFPWLNSGEIANFPIIDSDLKITEAGIKNSATTLMPKGTCVLSITRHLRPSILGVDSCANQSVVGIFESEKLKNSFIYPYLVNDIPRLMTLRSGAQQPHINKGTVDDSKMIIPTEQVLNQYYSIVDAFFEKIINNAFQIKQFAELRDWLLPMLMNGQVRIDRLSEPGGTF
jgi:type I restriction enzyme S subunit